MKNTILMKARHRKKLTQTELARKAGLDKNYVCQLESNSIKPRPRTIKAIASALEIDPELLDMSFGNLPKRYVSLLQKHPREIAELFEELSLPQNEPGKLIVFEGIEGAGKTTQIFLLSNWLKESGYPVIVTKEPGGTELGKAVRSLLLESDEAIAPQTELLLYAADRHHHIETIIRPQLAAGNIVLCDRFIDSTIAYQGYGRGMDLELIGQINDMATGGIKSDLTLWLDIDVEMGLARVEKRGKSDRIERAAKDFHHRVRQGFTQLAKENGQICRIDAGAPVANVKRQVQKLVKILLIKEFPLPL